MKAILVMLVLFASATASAATYYISTGGSDAAECGPLGSPCASLEHTCNIVATANGDVIRVNAGTYLETQQCHLAVGVSIEGEGATPTIRSHVQGDIGTGSDDALVMLEGGANTGQHISNVKFDGELTGYRAISVYDRDNVTIDDCTFTDFYRDGVKFEGSGESTGNSFHDNTVYNCAGAIDGTWGPGSERGSDLRIDHNTGMTIYNNQIDQQVRSGDENGVAITVGDSVYGLKICDNEILAFAHSSPDHPNYCFALEFWANAHTSGWGTEIYGNTIVGELDLGAGGDSKGTYDFSYDIHDNVFGDGITYAADEGYRTALQFEIQMRYISVRNNIFRKGLTRAIYFCSQAEYSNDVQDFQIYKNVFEGITYGYAGHGGLGNAIDFGANQNPRIVKNISILNNTFVSNADAPADCGIYLPTIVDCDDIYVKNNIFVGFTNAALVAEYQVAEGTLDNLVLAKNLFYDNGSNNELLAIGFTPSVTNDGGIVAQPLFVSPTDFHLQVGPPASPAIDAGENVGLAFCGLLPDLGAFETGCDASCSGPSSEECALANGIGSHGRTCNSGVWSNWGICSVVSCDNGYVISGNACVPVDTKDITRFTILDIDGVIGANTIDLTVPFGTALTSLTPTITHTGASVSPASGVAQDFTSAVAYTVTAADASTKSYIATIAVGVLTACVDGDGDCPAGCNETTDTDCSPGSCVGPASQACTLAHGTGSQSRTCTAGVWSDWGSCEVASCDSGYAQSNNACVGGGSSALTGGCACAGGAAPGDLGLLVLGLAFFRRRP